MLIKHTYISLLDLAHTNYIEGYLFFRPSTGFYGKLLGNFCHVSVAIRSNGIWIGYDPSLDITVITAINHWTNAKPDGDSVTTLPFKLLRKINRYRCPQVITIFSCVELIKSLLGIKSMWMIFPKQLFNYINQTGKNYDK